MTPQTGRAAVARAGCRRAGAAAAAILRMRPVVNPPGGYDGTPPAASGAASRAAWSGQKLGTASAAARVTTSHHSTK